MTSQVSEGSTATRPATVCGESWCGHAKRHHREAYGSQICLKCGDANQPPVHLFTLEPSPQPGDPGAVW